MRQSKLLREKYHVDYSDSTEFASKARLLQSIWREENKLDFNKYGNYLEENFAMNSGKNFLTKNIFELVKSEVKIKHIEGKVIQEPRIWNNLLSSQPLAFNLFGELKYDLSLATKLFQKLYPFRNIKDIKEIKFEYSPGRKNEKYTGDSSAFDVFVEYKNRNNADGFMGIEVKYAEDLNDKPSSHKQNYEVIADNSKIFDMSKINELKEKPIQQIWRDHLLALSLFITNNDYQIGDFIYLYPMHNKNCEFGLRKYKETFIGIDNHFLPLTIEELVESLKSYCKAKWILDFEDRYLNFDKIKNA